MYISLNFIILFVVFFLIALYYLYLSRKELKDIKTQHEKAVEDLWKKINNLDTQIYHKERSENELQDRLQEEARKFEEHLEHLSMKHAIKEVRLTFNCSEEEAEHIWVILEYHVDEETHTRFYNEYSIAKRKKIYKDLTSQESK